MGDELLKAVAGRLRHGVRPEDLAIRYGGDEFLIGARGSSAAIQGRLGGLLNADYRTTVGLVRVQINVGLVSFPEEAQALPELLQIADKKMYLHKKRPRQGL